MYEDPIELKLYFDTHHKKDGTWTHPQAQENYEQMKALCKQAIDEGTEISGRQILEKVLKSKSGYARGLGYGVKPISSKDLEFEAILQAEKMAAEKKPMN
ncbi:hypothetical protein GH714_019394 [Hevea brasiliensis]|uniref:Uncharacterized protein n=1 Tax=Hevea brasiliensis TaxID=3981 RepID=A0A6A6L1P6_HEVBR|nr:hypothetical protein GH714_019394 [Hevea brasiliensis]